MPIKSTATRRLEVCLFHLQEVVIHLISFVSSLRDLSRDWEEGPAFLAVLLTSLWYWFQRQVTAAGGSPRSEYPRYFLTPTRFSFTLGKYQWMDGVQCRIPLITTQPYYAPVEEPSQWWHLSLWQAFSTLALLTYRLGVGGLGGWRLSCALGYLIVSLASTH